MENVKRLKLVRQALAIDDHFDLHEALKEILDATTFEEAQQVLKEYLDQEDDLDDDHWHERAGGIG